LENLFQRQISATWYSGAGHEISFLDILNDIDTHTRSGGDIFVGTDSMLNSRICIFATAICLHGSSSQTGGRYYFKRTRDNNKRYSQLKTRIMKEVSDSLELGGVLLEIYPDTEIEIHVDVGVNQRSRTKPLADMIRGWTRASGFVCKIKPFAWASASVADKHTK
tara:strand:+ start:981 stop:1475 length:495 start_codon:yes stop_codon:yes gene_type:complete